MDYNKTFIDYEKMLREGMLQGFLKNDFVKIYEYLYARRGVAFANSFMYKTKREKRLYCAKLIVEYIYDNETLCQKAQKYIDKCEKRKGRK